jgi:hypothetical protein
MARPGIYSDLTGRNRPFGYRHVLKVAMILAMLALLARALLGSDPVVQRDRLTGECVAIELYGLYYPCSEPRFQGQWLESVAIEPETTLVDLQRRSGQK